MVSAAAAAFPFRDERRKLCQATISTPPTRSNRQPCTPDHQASRLASKHHLGMLCDTRGQGAFLNRHHVFSFWLVNEFSGRSVHSDMSKCIANNPLCAQGCTAQKAQEIPGVKYPVGNTPGISWCILTFGVFLALFGVFRGEIPQSPSVWGISHGVFPK